MKKALCFSLSLLLCFALSGCAKNTETTPTQQATATVTKSDFSNASVGDTLETQADFENALPINFDTNNIPDTGVTMEGTACKIMKGGTYIISGTHAGQLLVNADKQDVWLIFDNAHINCENSAPLYIEDARNTYIVAKSESKNSLSDSSSYNVSADEDPDATLFCKNDLIIGGGGSLTIDSNYNNALHTKDTLTICGGNISIDSVDTGIKAKDGLSITGGILDVTCAGDGIQTTNSEDPSLGNIEISGGYITVKSQKDAIQSENALTVSGGSFDLTSGGGAENADYAYNQQMMPPHRQYYETETDTVSMKGLKAQGSLTVSGGTFLINSEDDSIHSNSNINISGGEFNLSSGDDGIHADDILNISGGNIAITQSYEGLEGTTVDISGGNIHLSASDDGINSAGGGDTMYGGFGPDSFMGSSDCAINVSGGYIYIEADGDGIDSNGSLTFDGGTTIVNGPESGGNSPIDWEKEGTINGGTVIACGSAEMMEAFSSSSAQCIMALNLGTTISKGTLCNITCESTDFSLTYSVGVNSGYLLISTPQLKTGETYKISTGGSHSGECTDGLYNGGTYSGGELFTEITQESTVTVYGSSFGGMGGGMGGFPMGGPGGRR